MRGRREREENRRRGVDARCSLLASSRSAFIFFFSLSCRLLLASGGRVRGLASFGALGIDALSLRSRISCSPLGEATGSIAELKSSRGVFFLLLHQLHFLFRLGLSFFIRLCLCAQNNKTHQQQLPHDATEPELSSLFSSFGAVTGVQLLKDGEGNSRGKEGFRVRRKSSKREQAPKALQGAPFSFLAFFFFDPNLFFLSPLVFSKTGCALVFFSRLEHAETACSALDGTESLKRSFGGESKPIVVTLAGPRRRSASTAGISSAPSLLPNGVGEGRKRASADLPRTRSSPQPPSAPPPRRLFADNLPRDAAEE